MLIVIKEKNNVHIAIDAWGSCDCLTSEDMIHKENLPLWRVENVPNCLMATTGVSSFGYDLLRYRDLGLRTALTPRNLMTKICPKIKQTLAEFGQLNGSGENWGGLLLARGGKAVHLYSDLSFFEIEESYAFGRDDEVARGVLLMTKGEPPLERIRKVCQMMESAYKYRAFPAVVMSTASNERTVLYE